MWTAIAVCNGVSSWMYVRFISGEIKGKEGGKEQRKALI